MLDIGLEIRILRERLKVSAKELAERVGLSQSQMSRLEKGQRRIDTKVLHRIADALGVDPSHFFRGEGEPAEGDIPPILPGARNAPSFGNFRLAPSLVASSSKRSSDAPGSIVDSLSNLYVIFSGMLSSSGMCIASTEQTFS